MVVGVGQKAQLGLLSAMSAGVISGALSCLYAISLANIIFTGSNQVFLGVAIPITLMAAVAGALTAVGMRSGGLMIIQTQSVVAVVLAVGTTTVAQQLEGADSEVLRASLLLLVAVTTLATGLIMLLIGLTGAEQIAKSIPYPVIGGFLAATGYILVARSVQFGLQGGEEITALLHPDHLRQWVPAVAAAVLMRIAQQRYNLATVLTAGVLGYCVLTYLGLGLTGMSAGDARAMGVLMNLPPEASFLRLPEFWAFAPGNIARADWGVVLAQYPLIITAASLGVLGALLNMSAIEFASGDTRDIKTELRVSATGNLLSGLVGGIVVYPSATLTQLAIALGERSHLRVTSAVLLTTLAILFGGADLINLMPRGLFTMLLCFIGLSFLWRWLVSEYTRMPREDYLIVLLILVCTLLAGFVWAILLGVVVASLRFTIAYARLPVLRNKTTGAMRLSSTERADSATELLVRNGAVTQIFSAQGYMFFGTANGLFSNISEALENADPHQPLRNVVVDFQHVQGIDVSAIQMFDRLAKFVGERGARLVFTGLKPQLSRQIKRGITGNAISFEASMDIALNRLEEETLRDLVPPDGATTTESFSAGFRALFQEIEAAGLDASFAVDHVAAGQRLFATGEPADSMLLVEKGRLYATIREDSDPAVRVATFLPGSIVGEIGFVMGGPRTASIIAETDCTLRQITHTHLALLERENPQLALQFSKLISSLLARRLARTTALLHAVAD